MNKTFSVWLKIDGLKYATIKQAVQHAKDQCNQLNDGMLTRFNGQIKVLEELTMDFYPKK